MCFKQAQLAIQAQQQPLQQRLATILSVLHGASHTAAQHHYADKVQTRQLSARLRAPRQGRTKRGVYERASKPVDCTGPFTLSVGYFLESSSKQKASQSVGADLNQCSQSATIDCTNETPYQP